MTLWKTFFFLHLKKKLEGRVEELKRLIVNHQVQSEQKRQLCGGSEMGGRNLSAKMWSRRDVCYKMLSELLFRLWKNKTTSPAFKFVVNTLTISCVMFEFLTLSGEPQNFRRNRVCKVEFQGNCVYNYARNMQIFLFSGKVQP